jgi:hypothetical protein
MDKTPGFRYVYIAEFLLNTGRRQKSLGRRHQGEPKRVTVRSQGG